MDTNASVTTPKSDLGRLNTAVARLRAMGYLVADRGCCASCNWRALLEEYPDYEGPMLNFHDQFLDRAFGEPELTAEYAARLATTPEGDDDALEALFDEADKAGAFVRDEVQFGPLWICHHGTAAEIRRAVSVLREEGLDASWNGDEATNICINPRSDAATKEKRRTMLGGHIGMLQGHIGDMLKAMIDDLEDEGNDVAYVYEALARLEAELRATADREVAR